MNGPLLALKYSISESSAGRTFLSMPRTKLQWMRTAIRIPENTTPMHQNVISRYAGRILFSMVLLTSAGFGARFVVNSGADATAAARVQAEADGEKVYLTRCMSCHQMNGQGVANVFPPLDGSEWVTGDKGRLVRVILHGLTGPIEVDGVMYQSAMPPWGTFLTDAEVAAVGTYVRGSWSNDADPLTEAEVAAIRSATAERKAPYTAEELAVEGGEE